MKNVISINGYQTVIFYDPEIEMFRGEFIGLNQWVAEVLDKAAHA